MVLLLLLLLLLGPHHACPERRLVRLGERRPGVLPLRSTSLLPERVDQAQGRAPERVGQTRHGLRAETTAVKNIAATPDDLANERSA